MAGLNLASKSPSYSTGSTSDVKVYPYFFHAYKPPLITLTFS